MVNKLFLDVSELEAPEPLSQIISLTKKLTYNSYLHIIHRREPFPLYDILNENGFNFYTSKLANTKYQIFICIGTDNTMADYCLMLQQRPVED